MFRLSRFATQAFKSSAAKLINVKHAQASIKPASNFHFSRSFSTTHYCNMSNKESSDSIPAATIATDTTTPSEEEIDDLETIDPKEYPELYPEESDGNGDLEDEQVDTEWFVDPEYNDEKEFQETDFIPLWQRRALGEHLEDRLALQKVSKDLMESGKLTAESLVELLEESKMDNVRLIDVREKCDWADYMIVAESHKGDKYLSGVAEHIGGVVKKAIQSNPNSLKSQPAPHIEGRNDKSGWLLIDLGRVIVHLFTPEMKERYDIEGLWNSVSTDPTEPMSIKE